MSAVRVCGSMLSTRPSRVAPSQVRRARRDLSVRADPLKMPDKFSMIDPKGDYLLVRVAEQEDVTPGGILIPSASLRRPTTGEVVAIGDGNMPDGVTWEFKVETGDAVLYSKFGFMFTEVELKGELYIVVREADIIAKMPNAPARAEDVPDMTPMSDRVLIKIDEVSDISSGGVMLPESAKDRPLSGTVIKVGPGKQEKDGSVTPVKVSEGDKVLYFKYAGDNMETPDGTQYVVVHASDILCKA